LAVRVVETSLHQLTLRTRLPFRYGIATLTECPHLLCRVTLEVDGKRFTGISADNLPPKWFTKDPNQSYGDEVEQMLAVIRSACGFAERAGPADSVFELWQRVDGEQSRWGREAKLPPLLSGFGTSLLERAVIEAYCRATAATFAAALRDGRLGVRLDAVHAELGQHQPKDFLPPAPLRAIVARHTVGLLDPLTDEDIAPADRVDDGLPQSLEGCIRAYGLTHFKLKLAGDVAADAERLRRIADVIALNAASGYALTIDGNENFRDVAPLRSLWSSLRQDVALSTFLGRVLFLEQPLHRDVALSDATAAALRAWWDRPPMIIDESGATADDVRRALDIGYVGTSHKNCKGVFKGVANACLVAHRRRQTGGNHVLSGEDLTNIGPVALQQDLAVMASLGVTHVERNAHHYFAGLTMWQANVQERALHAHPDLYGRAARGFPSVRIEQGAMRVGSVADAPLGVAFGLDISAVAQLNNLKTPTH
jgi:hypothetical protein